MKKGILSAKRRSFPSFEVKLSPFTAIKFVVEGLSLFLIASIPDFGFALSLGLFCGFVYARQNIVALSPAFIIAACVFMFSWWTLLYAVCPIALLIALYFAFYRMRKNVPLYAVALTALAGMIPFAVCKSVFDGAYMLVAVSCVLAVVATFVAGIAAYAVLVRGVAHEASVDELMCAGTLVVIFAYALSNADFMGFKLVYIAAGFVLLLSVNFANHVTIFVSLLMGIGAGLQSNDMAVMAAIALLGLAAVAFAPFTKWASALAMLAAQGLMWLVNAYPGAGWRTLVMTAVGVIACLCVPKSALIRLKNLTKSDDRTSYAGVVNRQARNMAGRLYSASEVFYEMSKGMDESVDAASVFNADRLAHEVARNYCGKCADRDSCFKALGGDTYPVLKPMAEAALGRGKVTILDMPTFVTSRCSKTHSLAAVVNSLAETYLKRREVSEGIIVGKNMMSEQFAGVALILDSLAEECSMPVSFAGGEADDVKAELLKHNVVASELIVSGKADSRSVTALVRVCDAEKSVLPKVVSQCLGQRMCVVKTEDKGEYRLVFLESAPMYEVAYGVGQKCRESEGVCGDSSSVLCPSIRRRLFAICDGMGSGEEASKASRDAVNMIESFYRAGFDNGIILSLVNKLLRISLNDSFTSLDISAIDAATGGLDVIKLGAASSFIVRKDSIEVLKCTQPPAGMLDGIQPLTSRYQLYDGDVVIMMSDGVFDALEAAGVAEAVEAADTVNPQKLADELLSRALKAGAQDDCTAIVMRLFAV